jgi:hypothetical protein
MGAASFAGIVPPSRLSFFVWASRSLLWTPRDSLQITPLVPDAPFLSVETPRFFLDSPFSRTNALFSPSRRPAFAPDVPPCCVGAQPSKPDSPFSPADVSRLGSRFSGTVPDAPPNKTDALPRCTNFPRLKLGVSPFYVDVSRLGSVSRCGGWVPRPFSWTLPPSLLWTPRGLGRCVGVEGGAGSVSVDAPRLGVRSFCVERDASPKRPDAQAAGLGFSW